MATETQGLKDGEREETQASPLWPQCPGGDPFCQVPLPNLLPHTSRRKSFLQSHLFFPKYTPT